jgi:hypothetical protein
MNRLHKSKQLISILRWLARLGSLVSVVLLLLFLFGEGLHPSQLTLTEVVGLLFFPIGVMVGMLLGWRWETPGGAVTVLSLLAFYKVMYAASGRFPEGIWFALFALPGLLFLYCGLCNRQPTHKMRMG